MMKAMFSGVAGLKSHQMAMDVIGNNIANVNTNAFKSSRTIFRDMMYSTLNSASGSTNTSGGSNPSQVGCGSQVSSIDINNSNGGRVSTDRTLDTYLSGEGYFTVADGSGNTLYTRLGSLDFDSDGNLVDGNSRYVMGYAPKSEEHLAYIDGVKINFDSTGSGMGPLLDGYTIKVVCKKAATGSNTISADGDTKTIAITNATTDGNPNLTRAQLETLLKTLGNTTGVWTNEPTTLDDPTTVAVENDKKFTDLFTTTIAGNIKVDGADAAPTNAKLVTMTSGKISETVTCNTDADPKKITYADINAMKNLSIDSTGTITGTNSKTGKIVVVGQLAIATFDNPNALTEMGNSYFSVSSNSGKAAYQAAGSGAAGKAVSSALEGSNVDLANEFSNMILTQRGFQANSKIITVTDTMMEELVNLKR